MLKDRSDAYELLKKIGAPDHLILHAQLVGEVADQLLLGFQPLGLSCDVHLVELGAAIHDSGKTRHLNELYEPGSMREHAGQEILLGTEFSPKLPGFAHRTGHGILPKFLLKN